MLFRHVDPLRQEGEHLVAASHVHRDRVAELSERRTTGRFGQVIDLVVLLRPDRVDGAPRLQPEEPHELLEIRRFQRFRLDGEGQQPGLLQERDLFSGHLVEVSLFGGGDHADAGHPDSSRQLLRRHRRVRFHVALGDPGPQGATGLQALDQVDRITIVVVGLDDPAAGRCRGGRVADAIDAVHEGPQKHGGILPRRDVEEQFRREGYRQRLREVVTAAWLVGERGLVSEREDSTEQIVCRRLSAKPPGTRLRQDVDRREIEKGGGLAIPHPHDVEQHLLGGSVAVALVVVNPRAPDRPGSHATRRGDAARTDGHDEHGPVRTSDRFAAGVVHGGFS